jgi:HAD superfamily hydrolase (TIGR01450 family)
VSRLSALATGYDHVLLDLDGCVWVGDEPTEDAVEAVEALRAAGISVAFLTNDGRAGEEEVVRKLWRLGFRAALEEVVTVGAALQHRLAETAAWRAAYVIGAPAIHRHVADAGVRIVNRLDVPAADVVVVSGHEGFDYDELRGAVQAVSAGAALLCTGRDRTFPMPDGPWPATGPIVAAIEYATGATATSVGKPEGQLYRTAIDRLGAGRSLCVGDRLDADVQGAWAAGLDAALVLTGATTREQAQAAAQRDEGPLVVAESLAALLLDG